MSQKIRFKNPITILACLTVLCIVAGYTAVAATSRMRPPTVVVTFNIGEVLSELTEKADSEAKLRTLISKIEDGLDSSYAGYFHSELNVNSKNNDDIKATIVQDINNITVPKGYTNTWFEKIYKLEELASLQIQPILDNDYFEGKYPRGWFVVAYSHEIKEGEVKSLEYFGDRLVAFRDNAGQVVILDAYCAHLGADMGVGGKTENNCVRCPFHAWKYDRSGACVDVPYADKIPPKAKIRLKSV
mgnify:CR=1 FL=1